MLPNELFKYWKMFSGIEEQLVKFGFRKLFSVQKRIRHQVSLQSPDSLRSEIAQTDRSDNSALAWYLLSDAVKVGFKPESRDKLQRLLDWQLMVTDKSDEQELLRAHGCLIRGMHRHDQERLFEARDDYQLSLENYQRVNADPKLQSICQFCLALVFTDLDVLKDALPAYEKAIHLSSRSADINSSYTQLVLKHRDKAVKQDRWLRWVVEEIPQQQWRVQFKKDRRLIDDDLLRMAKSLCYQNFFGENYPVSRKVAALVDRLDSFRGQPGKFRLELSDLCKQNNKYLEDEVLLREMLAEGQDEDVKVRLGYSLYMQNKVDQAKEIYMAVLGANPNHARAHSELGSIYVVEKNWSKARHHLDKALKLDPEDAMAKHFSQQIPQVGVGYDPKTKSMYISGDMKSADPDEMAVLMMASIIAGNPDKAGELLEDLKRDKGEEIARRVMALLAQQKKQSGHLKQAEKFFSERKYDLAIPEYKLAIEENPKDWEAYMGLGDTYFMMGKFNMAVAYFEESINIQPYAPTYRFLGDAYLQLGDLDKAYQAFQNAVKLDPNYAPARQSLQLVKSRMGKRR